MKKIICLFIAICLVIGTVPSLAEEMEKTIPDTWKIIYGGEHKEQLFWAEINGDICTIMAVSQCSNNELIVPGKDRLFVKVDPIHSTIGEPLNVNAILIDKDALKKGAEQVETITFEEGYEGLPDNLCEGFQNLKTVNLPESLYVIGNSCFKDCAVLENINLEYVQHIGTDAFLGTKIDLNKKEESLFSDMAITDDCYEAVKVLSSLGIMQGYKDGTFKCEGTLTRAEAAAIMVRLVKLEDDVTKGEKIFSDVPESHWAAGYINTALENGMINGQGDGTFAPDEYVTYEQIIKMVVCALGYEPYAVANGGWKNGGYTLAASKINLIEGINIIGSENAKRGDIAKIVYNALDVELMDYNNICFPPITFVILENRTLMTEYWECDKVKLEVQQVADEKAKCVIKEFLSENESFISGQVVKFTSNYDLSEYVGEKITAYIKKDEAGDHILIYYK